MSASVLPRESCLSRRTGTVAALSPLTWFRFSTVARTTRITRDSPRQNMRDPGRRPVRPIIYLHLRNCVRFALFNPGKGADPFCLWPGVPGPIAGFDRYVHVFAAVSDFSFDTVSSTVRSAILLRMENRGSRRQPVCTLADQCVSDRFGRR